VPFWETFASPDSLLFSLPGIITLHRYFCTASTSLSPLPPENTGLSVVRLIRKENYALAHTNDAPDSRAMVLEKKLSLVDISVQDDQFNGAGCSGTKRHMSRSP
jgi:hypothetical protein